MVKLVEAFLHGGHVQPFVGTQYSLLRDAGLARPLVVSGERLFRMRAEVVADDAQTAGARELYVPGALLDGGVGVVYDERLLGLDTGAQKELLPVTGLEHVEVDPEVGVEEACLVERRFPGRLDPDEDDRLHAAVPTGGSTSSLGGQRTRYGRRYRSLGLQGSGDAEEEDPHLYPQATSDALEHPGRRILLAPFDLREIRNGDVRPFGDLA